VVQWLSITKPITRRPQDTGRTRPTPRTKTPAGIAYTKTVALKRRGVIDRGPSKTKPGRLKWDIPYEAKRSKRRIARTRAIAELRSALPDTPFTRQVFKDPACPSTTAAIWEFVLRKFCEQLGISPPKSESRWQNF
jgi:hypothetical protein